MAHGSASRGSARCHRHRESDLTCGRLGRAVTRGVAKYMGHLHCTEKASFLDSPPHGVKLQQWLRRRFPPTAEHRKLDSCSAPVGGVARQAHQGGGLGWHGAAYFEGASMSQPPSAQGCCGALDPPVGGTFHFEILVMPPLPKTCPKMVLSHKGGSLCVKDAFGRNFLVPGEIPLAARSHRFFGNLMRSSVVSGTVRGLALQGGQGLAAPIQNDSGLPQSRAGASGVS